MIGAGARRVRRDVVPALPQQRFDAILLSVGVNDVLKLERSGRFRRQLLKLLRDLRTHSPHAVIAYLGLPPLDEFPKAAAAAAMDRRLSRAQVRCRRPRCAHANAECAAHSDALLAAPDMFSSDGLHPSETSQRRLAKIIAGALTPRLAGIVARRRARKT